MTALRTRSTRTTVVATLAALVVAGAAACGSTPIAADPSSPSVSRSVTNEESSRALVVDFYDRFFNHHDVSAADVIADAYKQHNPQVPDGKAPFVDYFRGYFEKNPLARNRIVRSAVTDDLVYLHVHATNGDGDRGQAIVDIFRVRDNRIVEHWDVIQDVPDDAANDNTMF